MTTRPILFSAPMVRAILDGRKTQTRRVVDPQPPGSCVGWVNWGYRDKPDRWSAHAAATVGGGFPFLSDKILCPYGAPGDELWVKETWRTCAGLDHLKPTDIVMASSEDIDYRATHNLTPLARPGRWRPSIFMRRWMSRITLRITDVRVERLQEISLEDCMAEGIGHLYRYEGPEPALDADWRFRELWDSINAKRAPWADNPWVWVVSFEVTS